MEDKTVMVIQDPAAVMPILDIQTAIARRDQMVKFVQAIMREGEDYGVIPGAGTKKVLMKPGAEKLTTFFGLTKRFNVLESVVDWDRPFFYFNYRCSLYRGDMLIAESDGSCNSHEVKYRYRQADRKCPACGMPTIIKGKEEWGGGWVCFKKKGGCGAKFPDGDKSIEGQQVGRVENPDAADLVNTIQKMAQKRALVACTLLAVNASEFFTQDLEDEIIDGQAVEVTPPQPEAPKPTNGNRTPAMFFSEVLAQIPYYNHIEHVKNTLKQYGYMAYKPSLEAAMREALRTHANEKANEEASHTPATELQGEVAQGQQISEETAEAAQ